MGKGRPPWDKAKMEPEPVPGGPIQDPRHPATAAISDIVMSKARTLEKTGMAEIDYDIEIEVQGMKVRDNGCIRRDPYTPPPVRSSRGLFGGLRTDE